MPGAFVQGWTENSDTSSSASPITVVVTGATANNLLVAVASSRNLAGGTYNAVTGWTLIQKEDSNVDAQAAVFYRIATGTTADNFTISTSGGNGYMCAAVAEYSGLDAIAPLEDSGENTDNVDTNTASQPTGSATPTSADGTAIAFFSSHHNIAWITDGAGSGLSLTGFSRDQFVAINAPAARPGAGIFSKNYTTTAAQSGTFTTTETGIERAAYGAMAVFKAAGGGGDKVLRILQSSAWVKAVPWVLQSGAWVKAVPHVLQSGAWAETTETT